mmetsp:Transcript_11695/g.21722  ORF Transcript_11695/g.21722 Transcript_11695/m.21722 type:complete len:86 (+) Transcript_11695:174-431(+)
MQCSCTYGSGIAASLLFPLLSARLSTSMYKVAKVQLTKASFVTRGVQYGLAFSWTVAKDFFSDGFFQVKLTNFENLKPLMLGRLT